MKSATELCDLSGDVAVITGAGRGIGEGIAKVLASAGAAVVCAARRTEEIERVAAEINASGGKAIAVTTDITDSAALEALTQVAVDTFGGIDIWVNNAGGSSLQLPLVELPEDEWQSTIELNLSAPWRCCKVAVPKMRDGGRIINISSLSAERVVPGSGHYGAAKAALNLLTKNLAAELGPRIRVNAIMPGFIPSETVMKVMKITDDDLPAIEKQLNPPAGRLGTPEDIGAAILYLAAPSGGWMTGQILNVSGGR